MRVDIDRVLDWFTSQCFLGSKAPPPYCQKPKLFTPITKIVDHDNIPTYVLVIFDT